MNRAIRYAQSALTRYWDKQIPVRPDLMVERIDTLQICYADLEDDSGSIEYDSDIDKYIIAVNARHHKNRQRFTIAHELGHYMLKHVSKKDGVMDRNGDSNPYEIEANAFAAEILMPTAVIRHLIFEQDVVTVEELAHKLWVSEQAMFYRLRNLGLIS